mmetsp:Transcript_57962/g.154457  ORF Transcript_57962/g.154457 Transcript_57962/m.154457 type:complete len:226 (-) Transcript_57962:69-746(-)
MAARWCDFAATLRRTSSSSAARSPSTSTWAARHCGTNGLARLMAAEPAPCSAKGTRHNASCNSRLQSATALSHDSLLRFWAQALSEAINRALEVAASRDTSWAPNPTAVSATRNSPCATERSSSTAPSSSSNSSRRNLATRSWSSAAKNGKATSNAPPVRSRNVSCKRSRQHVDNRRAVSFVAICASREFTSSPARFIMSSSSLTFSTNSLSACAGGVDGCSLEL